MMDAMLLPLVPPSAPVLHEPAHDVLGFDQLTIELVSQLTETLWAIDGALGLAAPQVGLAMRIAVLADPVMPVIINPRIIATSKDARMKTEGCLSYPDQRFRVRRWNSVTVAYRDQFGKLRSFEAHGRLAQVLQHEIDHLDGRTIAD